MLPSKLSAGNKLAFILLLLCASTQIDVSAHDWHNGPINCFNCDDIESCAEEVGILRKCDGNDSQTCLTVFNQAGSVVRRGCNEAVQDQCNANGNSCYECRSHGCNTVESTSEFVDCVVCEATSDCVFNPETITETRKCHQGCLTALYPRTNATNAPLELTRSCLDDLDLDEREACKSSNDGNCIACSTSRCNTAALGERSTCYTCASDEDCEIPEIEECQAVSTKDQCYMLFDEYASVVEMGCLSKYDNEEIENLVANKRLWICEGENCNAQNAIPMPQSCAICSSRTDPNCAIAPTLITSRTNCDQIPYTQCYERILEEGHTERGCISALNDETFYNCLIGANATECKICSGGNCNLDVHPVERLSCHVCNSKDSSDCDVAPSAEQTCLLYRTDEKCVTKLDMDGNTVRGCSSEISCDGNDSNTCKTCEGSNCNTNNLKRKLDGKPGQWQDLPLKCRSCNSTAECATESSTTSNVCTETEYCMTVFDTTGAIAARGCSNTIEQTHGNFCDQNSELCHNCNSNECNTANSLSDYVECIYCDSATNNDCAVNAELVEARRLCNGDCMTAMYPQANSTVYGVRRSCLDDKDKEDQVACSNNDKECSACRGVACNNDNLAESRLSCWSCDSNCDDAEPKACTNYSPNDKCYTLYSNNSDIVAMGCLSDLTEAFINQNIHLIYSCDTGDNCNSFENTPKPNNCVTCSSNDNEDCAVDPENIGQISSCTTLPNTGCMTRVLSDGSTERGCLSALSTQNLRNCLLGVGNCKVCNEPLCNQEIYPEDRRRCHRCNSEDDPTCINAPAASGVCPRYNNTQTCNVKYVDGHTYRGCGSDFICDDSDKQYCRICSGDNCNIADLEANNIGYPGKWQTLPINCYTCVGEECEDNSLGGLQKCQNNDAQNCATVFNEDGAVVQRGCSDSVYNGEWAQYCDANPINCKFCKSTGCNNAEQLESYIDCIFCDGSENGDCVTQADGIARRISCQESCFTALYARNSSDATSALELYRGCLDDLEYDDRLSCAAGNREHCESCDSDSCNTALVPRTRLSCNYCSDAACSNEISKTCTAYRDNDQCYIHVDDARIESMGCASDLETSFLESNKRDLKLCDGNNCNVKDDLNLAGTSCYICNSTDSINCLSNPPMAAVCQHYLYPECYTHITADGVLQRGCLKDTENDLFENCNSGSSSTCEICNTNNCNGNIYPAGRRSCLRCDSNSDSGCEKNAGSYASLCPIYDPEDACVTKVERTRTLRGCQSELACDEEDSNCRVCNADNCNNVDLLAGYVGEPGKWQTLPLNCLVCDSEDECDSGSTLHKCQNNNKQVCVTVFGNNSRVIKRGCSDSVDLTHSDYCDNNSGQCFKCKSTGCNNATSTNDYIDCFFCDAEEDSSCAHETPQVTTTRTRKCQKQCVTALYPRSLAEDTAYLPTRTCLDDLELSDREECLAGTNTKCKACDTGLCNSADIIEEPNECLVCETSDCENIGSRKCVAYRPDDKCYIAFDDTSIVAMGCTSDYETQVVNELVQQQKMFLCSGKNCNSPDNIPGPTTCSICDSASDPRCATNPNTIFDTIDCTKQPYTQCATHVDENGHTQRGCLSSLENSVFYGCLTGNNSLCEVCSDEKCNGNSVFPSDRLKCHQCDSSTDPNCASSPQSNAVCPIYVENDACVTTQRDGITIRGCNSTITCDATDTRNCRICRNGDGCNTIDLEKMNADGSPGIWQDVPITCHVCTDEADCAGETTLRACTTNVYQNCLTVFNANGNVIQRGCSDSVLSSQESYCESNPTRCPRCNSNACNVATSPTEYVDCVACDSATNANCVQNVAAVGTTRQCYKKCMTALRHLFNEENDAYSTVRSCYDDKDEEDREACESGEDDQCSACSGAKCNVDDIVAQRLSCNICTGDECQVLTGKTCPTYRKDDQCFIEYDEQQAPVAFGCLSQYSHQEVYNLQKLKRLLLCGGDDCNTFESIPDPQSCSVCNSRTDEACATNPSSITAETSCLQPGIPQCYSRVLDDGSTERGCLSSLYDDEFLSCYNGTSTSCVSCTGDNCNMNVYPVGRRSCHICSSDANANCESSPNSISICPLYAEPDVCVSTYRDGVTIRGCSSSIDCDESDPRKCVKCEGDGCNVVDLSTKQDDNFGKWQDLPLTCYSCTGDDCSSAESTSSALCENNNEQDCVTIFNESGTVARRGCSDEVVEDCAQNSANCFKCKSNLCNTARALSEFTECVYCDSFTDVECLWSPNSTRHRKRQCQGGCMTALYPAYDAENGALEIIRTCLNDKEPADQTICSGGRDTNCTACSTPNCNVDTLPRDRLNCYICEGTDCENPTSKPCTLYQSDDRCFTLVDESNNVAQLGCLSSFRNQDLESVIKTKRVTVCDGANCNLPTLILPKTCTVCDSQDDPNCAINPEAVGTLEICNQMPYTHCVTQLESDGTVHRGCLFNVSQNDFAACVLGTNQNCSICAEDGCNRELFPRDWPKCFTCTSEDDANCESSPNYGLGCPLYDSNERCVTSLSNNVTARGCASSITCDAHDYQNCRICQGPECNGIDLRNRIDDGVHGFWQNLPLKCYGCLGEQCNNSLGIAYTCLGNTAQDCKTVFEANGVTVRRRGCADDVDDYEDLYCRRNPQLCFTCKSNECNDAWNVTDYVDCAFCNSETDPLCVINPENSGFGTRSCQGQCLVALKGQDLIRSCLDDKELYDRNECSDNEAGKQCAKCEGAQCNKFVYPADRLRCHICTGDACTSSVAEYCLLYDESDFCFAKYENSQVDRLGCSTSQNVTDLEQWQSDRKLYRCDTNDCNDLAKLPREDTCLACNSSTNVNCAQDPLSVTTTAVCSAPNNQCVTRIDQNGNTVRGCLSSLSSNEQNTCIASGTCAACSGSKCNTDIFPANRRRCHICSSAETTSCSREPNALSVCPIYQQGDSCVARYTNGLVERGCHTELTCDVSDERRCQICQTDGCNTAILSGASSLIGSSLLLTLILACVTTLGWNH